MKTKRFISLLTISFYLLSVVGYTYSAFMCSCVSVNLFVETSQEHTCASGCSHDHQEVESQLASSLSYNGACCSDEHSTEIDLYIPSSENNTQLKRLLFVELCGVISAQQIIDVGRFPLSITTNLVDRQAPFVEHPSLIGLNFRAPPVLA